jgi:hypothetical protein
MVDQAAERRAVAGLSRMLGKCGGKLGIALLALGQEGCFYAISAYRDAQICTPEAAERSGAEDARRGRVPQEGYARRCGVAEASLNRLYRKAYDGVPMAQRTRSLLDRLLRRDPPAADEAAQAR